MGKAKRPRRETAHNRRVSRLSSGRVYRYALTLALAALLCSPVAMVTLPMPDVRLLVRENPHTTDQILRHAAEERDAPGPVTRNQIWVPLREISPHLRQAVVLNEDSAFFSNRWTSLPWRESPLTRSLARSLYFSGEKSAGGEVAVAVTAFRIERALSRERILEIYLNVIEWGEGIYGAEAASENYFRKSAGELTRSEAALLACSLASPLEWNPAAPGRELHERAARLTPLLTENGAPAEADAPQQ